MSTTPFRVLYREFLFRIVDRELLSTYAQGDMSRLLVRFVALLLFVGIALAAPAMLLPKSMPPSTVVLVTWSTIDTLIATTMLVVGLFAVLSWNAIFPDRLDALVLTPLPIQPHTVFLAKLAAVGSGLSLAVVALNIAPSLVWPLRLYSVLPAETALPVAGIVIEPGIVTFGPLRPFIAYWVTMFAAGLFISSVVIGIQGLAANLLPRPAFLRASSYLQLATFVVVIVGYLLLPAAVTPARLAAAQAPGSYALPPWYWFLGIFQQLSGVAQIGALARYAWAALVVTAGWAAVAYTLSYFRTLRRIVEEPDIAPSGRAWLWWPPFGTGQQTAIVHFCIRTLLRSTQHRVILAFYWGFGFAITFVFVLLFAARLRPSGSVQAAWEQMSVPLMVSSILMMFAAVLAARVVLALPRDLRANWIFRIAPLQGGREYLGARRRAFHALSVAPVWIVSAAVLLVTWPVVAAAGHLLVLWLIGSTLAEVYLYGTRKIPFTCAYLPSASTYKAAFWVAGLFVLLLVAAFALLERRALDSPPLYAMLVAVLGAIWLSARLLTTLEGKAPDAQPQFEEEPSDLMTSLDVWDHRFTQTERSAGPSRVP